MRGLTVSRGNNLSDDVYVGLLRENPGYKETAASYPEHQKLAAISGQSQTIGEFLTWMFAECGIHRCIVGRGVDDRFEPDGRSVQTLLSCYFEIDLAVIEQEKMAMLNEMRDAQRGAE